MGGVSSASFPTVRLVPAFPRRDRVERSIGGQGPDDIDRESQSALSVRTFLDSLRAASALPRRTFSVRPGWRRRWSQRGIVASHPVVDRDRKQVLLAPKTSSSRICPAPRRLTPDRPLHPWCLHPRSLSRGCAAMPEPLRHLLPRVHTCPAAGTSMRGSSASATYPGIAVRTRG